MTAVVEGNKHPITQNKMSTNTIAQTQTTVQANTNRVKVYEYALTVVNPIDNDTQKLTAAFSFLPAFEDWQNWLFGWNSCGYSLQSPPQLIHTL